MSAASAASATSIWSSSWRSSSKKKNGENEQLAVVQEQKMEMTHKKRLAMILRYISTMHHSSDSSSSSSGANNTSSTESSSSSSLFVQECHNNNPKKLFLDEFFNHEQQGGENDNNILFSTKDFRHLLTEVNPTTADANASTSTLFASQPPFSFYAASAAAAAAATTANNKKRTITGTIKNSLFTASYSTTTTTTTNNYNNNGGGSGRACWLRLTRLAHEAPPPVTSYAVKQYLLNWKTKTNSSSIRHLLSSLDNVARAPKVAPTESEQNKHDIHVFLRHYKRYLKKNAVRTTLEPMYNCLFEWVQQQQSTTNNNNTHELVWGFGNARRRVVVIDNNDNDGSSPSSIKMVNGPLLEVLVEVELARDGAILVRPREHTGVALNRQVVSALVSSSSTSTTTTTTSSSSDAVLSNLYRTVSEMETSEISPGQPLTYTKLLKRMALELSPDGTFQKSSSTTQDDYNKLVVTDAWCLFSRRKPSTVWARDAASLAEQCLLLQQQQQQQETIAKMMTTTTTTPLLPRAAWSLTHGPGVLDAMNKGGGSNKGTTTAAESKISGGGVFGSLKSALFGNNDNDKGSSLVPKKKRRPLFPLPTSDAQNRIADLLLEQNYPAIVCEGPPGTGKTHTIANIVCAYLCQGKRVLVTSKGAPALSVLRERLPRCVRELCVDVSMSESTGMRQLQQTVERLADRVSCVSTELQQEKCQLLQRNITELETELQEIDEQLELHSERKRGILQSPDGQELADTALSLISSVPWFMKTIAPLTLAEVTSFHERTKSLVMQDRDPMELVTHYPSPPSDALVSIVASRAGKTLSVIKNGAIKTIASVPLLGTLLGMNQFRAQLQEQLDSLRIDGNPPQTRADWELILRALNHDQALHAFHREVVEPLVQREGWPVDELYEEIDGRRRIKKSFLEYVSKAARLKELAESLDVSAEIALSIEHGQLDSRRSKIAARMQCLAEDLVEATVVTELSRMFSAEAQSALIRFAQIAGKAKFSRASQPSKMSQRQRRHRQEYLEAFEKCVRYIPCWVLTSSQISDYLPPEFGLFDLVVIDEASQSDITVLPGMLRGKQWLIVGDGKQVSPTESFISEAQIESLRAALPECPLEDSLLPGHSFFDLCAQAFPTGRVVLSEHFRCAPEIIAFSNAEFYDERLVPLRLPTTSERMTPSIVDVRVKDGSKVGKVNEKECDTIVDMIQDFVVKSASDASPRSIGIISLIGDEQSRLIRGRLLDAIGPQKYKEHNILVGDPPAFQGAERDIIFLSMVSSAGSVPTQNQLMHMQRANVALSRARDRMVLVRSIDSSHIPNGEDIKVPIIEYFEKAGQNDAEKGAKEAGDDSPRRTTHRPAETSIFSFRVRTEELMETMLQDRGFSVTRMGVVWNNSICVENEETGYRAAVSIDCAGEPRQEWARMFSQQKSIERVGWKCMRVDALSMLNDFHSTFKTVEDFLVSVGVQPSLVDSDREMLDVESLDDVQDGGNDETAEISDNPDAMDVDEGRDEASSDNPDSASVVVISSDEEDSIQAKPSAMKRGSLNRAEIKIEGDDSFEPGQFGDVVELDFLRGETDDAKPSLSLDDNENDSSAESIDPEVIVLNDGDGSDQEVKSRNVRRIPSTDRDDAYLGDQSEEEESMMGRPSKRRRRNYRRLDKYSRDGRWYPGSRNGVRASDEDLEQDWYDTDSDLADVESNALVSTSEVAMLPRKKS